MKMRPKPVSILVLMEVLREAWLAPGEFQFDQSVSILVLMEVLREVGSMQGQSGFDVFQSLF